MTHSAQSGSCPLEGPWLVAQQPPEPERLRKKRRGRDAPVGFAAAAVGQRLAHPGGLGRLGRLARGAPDRRGRRGRERGLLAGLVVLGVHVLVHLSRDWRARRGRRRRRLLACRGARPGVGRPPAGASGRAGGRA